ncbi:hypothetical protein [Mobilicoccus massiliensis]|uniref:hypothetical protein n=1 Tax=Mobilicoccus massiliensis TaxID=1522310 RepID=UPI00058AEF40|nr:hypothetical protein [Mobilicoccus massiliensis]
MGAEIATSTRERILRGLFGGGPILCRVGGPATAGETFYVQSTAGTREARDRHAVIVPTAARAGYDRVLRIAWTAADLRGAASPETDAGGGMQVTATLISTHPQSTEYQGEAQQVESMPSPWSTGPSDASVGYEFARTTGGGATHLARSLTCPSSRPSSSAPDTPAWLPDRSWT